MAETGCRRTTGGPEDQSQAGGTVGPHGHQTAGDRTTVGYLSLLTQRSGAATQPTTGRRANALHIGRRWPG
jgi:hypothetical protein